MYSDTEESRIARVFGLTASEALPRVNRDTLLTYRQFLAAKVSFPFEALYAETKPLVRQLVHYVTVVGLVDRTEDGLFCVAHSPLGLRELPLAELGIREGDPNHQLLDDYAYWFWNGR